MQRMGLGGYQKRRKILKKQILLVEDSRFLRNTLARTLEYAGFVVTAVANGRLGLEQAQAHQGNGHPFDLLVTDILMPKMTGTELIKAVSEAGIDIPVLVITALQSAQRAQLQDFSPNLQVLEKPFPPTQLVQTVIDMIRVE